MKTKIALLSLSLALTMTSFASRVEDLMDTHLLSSINSLWSAKMLKSSAERSAAERDGCTTMGYVYGRASVSRDVLLKDGRNLLAVLNPALNYCNSLRLSNALILNDAETATLEGAIKALNDAYNNL